VIFSSIYLLWAYQRVFFGPVTQERNRELPDADLRERCVLVVMAALILWMASVRRLSRAEPSPPRATLST